MDNNQNNPADGKHLPLSNMRGSRVLKTIPKVQVCTTSLHHIPQSLGKDLYHKYKSMP